MKNAILLLAILPCLIIESAYSQIAQISGKGGYSLSIVNNDPTLDKAEVARLEKTFYTVYPELAKEYNPNTLKSVKIVIDTTYKGVAATANGKVTISNKWLHQHPEDIDVVTHEVMHIVQDYGEM